MNNIPDENILKDSENENRVEIEIVRTDDPIGY